MTSTTRLAFKKLFSVRPADRTRPYDAPSFQATDGEQPRRTPSELMRPKKPSWE